jgi:hypothetical protein
MKAPFSTALAIAVGIVVLLGYFLHLAALDSLRSVFLDWAVVLAAVALLIGVANLFLVHWQKFWSGGVNSLYSSVLLAALLITVGVAGWNGPTHATSLWIFHYVQVPVESSLLALLAVILVYAAIRLLKRRVNLLSVLFLGTVVIVLLATGPLIGLGLSELGSLRTWIAQVPAAAGARGILLGVALGTVATGLRILLGADRPYGG